MAKVGDKVPDTTLRMMTSEGPSALGAGELFGAGKKVVAFALPGAFTPT
jgi:glutaredoxin/glutathione-dependent peroxiredoxin